MERIQTNQRNSIDLMSFLEDIKDIETGNSPGRKGLEGENAFFLRGQYFDTVSNIIEKVVHEELNRSLDNRVTQIIKFRDILKKNAETDRANRYLRYITYKIFPRNISSHHPEFLDALEGLKSVHLFLVLSSERFRDKERPTFLMKQHFEEEKKECIEEIKWWIEKDPVASIRFGRMFIDEAIEYGREEESGYKELCNLFKEKIFEHKGCIERAFYKSTKPLDTAGKAQIFAGVDWLVYGLITYGQDKQDDIHAAQNLGTNLIISTALISSGILMQIPKWVSSCKNERKYLPF